MKTNINLTWGYIICFLFCIVGAVMSIMGIYRQVGIASAHPLQTLHTNNIRQGDYVSGYIDEIVMGDFAVQGVVMRLPAVYDIYTIKIADERYITMYISDPNTLGALEGFVDGVGEAVYIEGRILPPMSSNFIDSWFVGARGISDQSEIERLVISDLAIIQTDLDGNKNMIILGMFLVVGGLIIFWRCGGTSGLVRRLPTQEISYSELGDLASATLTPERINVYLEQANNELEHLMAKRQKKRDDAMVGAVMLPIGLLLMMVMIFANKTLHVEVFMMIAGVFNGLFAAGVVVCAVGIKKIFTAFVNSESQTADRLCGMFNITTTKMRIIRQKKQISRLEDIANNHLKDGQHS